MTQEKDSQDKFAGLRQRAEETVSRKPKEMEDISALSPDEVRRLVHELRVHQIELEMQNEDLRQAQINLEKLKDRYLDLYDFAPVGYFTLNDKALILEANLTAVRLLGVERQTLLNRPFSRFVSQEFGDAYYLYLRRVFETRSNQTCEIKLAREDGSEFYAELESVAVKDEEGQFNLCQTMVSDITERKRAEQLLRESEENFRTFSETADDMIIVATPDGRIMYTNPAMSHKLDYNPDKLREMHVLDLHPRELREEAERIFANMFKGEQEVCPLPVESKNGGLLPVETRCWLGKWSGLDCIFGFCKDLTREQGALQKFDKLFHNNPALLAVNSIPEQKFADVNDSFLNTLGFSREEVIGKTSAELGLFIQPEMQEAVAEEIEKQGKISNAEIKVRRKDGVILDALFSGEIVESQGQKSLLTVLIDITERKRAEKALRKSEERFRLIAETIVEVFWMSDVQIGTIFYVSPAYEKVWGQPATSLYENPKSFIDAIHEEDRERVFVDREVKKDGQPFDHEYRIVRPDGDIRWIWDRGFPVQDETGQVTRYVGIAHDITDRKEMEQALTVREQEYRTLVENITDLIVRYDTDLRRIYANPAWEKVSGVSAGDIINVSILGISGVPYPINVEYVEKLRQVIETGTRQAIEFTWVNAQGVTFFLSYVMVPEYDRDGKMVSVLALGHDLTESRRTEEALRLEHERFRLSAESLSDVIYEWDLGSSIKWFGNIDRLLGYAPGEFPHTREAWIGILHPEDRDRVLKAVGNHLSDGTIYDIEYRVQHKEGGWRDWVAKGTVVKDASGKPLRWIGAVTDTTDRKRMEELALQSARLRAVADLSSGVAHHFNNLLQIIMASTSLTLMELELGDLSKIKTTLEKMLQAAKLGAETVKRLQTFANIRADVTEREGDVFDAATTAGNAAEVFKPIWLSDPEKKGIKIDLKLDLEDGCLVKGQENEIFEVLVNLIRNAEGAMPQGGDIEVKAYREANEVVITVRDTGIGIAEADLPRVFQPFWSTRGVGIGKGMGLAVTHGLVKRHGGTISVQSKLGAGTTFTIRLPLAQV